MIKFYIKLATMIICGYFIYSAVNGYRYAAAIDSGRRAMQDMAEGKLIPMEYAGRFVLAEESMKKGIAIADSIAEPHLFLGNLYLDFMLASFDNKAAVAMETGLTEDSAERLAIEHLERAVGLNPFSADAHLALAWVYEHSGRSADADREALLAERAWPGRLRVRMKLLEWAVLRKDEERIRSSLDNISRISQNYLGPAIEIVWRVYQDYDTLRSLVPENAGARRIFARFLKSRGMKEEAKAEEGYARTLAE